MMKRIGEKYVSLKSTLYIFGVCLFKDRSTFVRMALGRFINAIVPGLGQQPVSLCEWRFSEFVPT
jgi:hypothetical protein